MHPGSGAALPLPRALRRLRNLIVAGLILRDLDGRADLAEVVATMTALADFSIQAALSPLMDEMVAQHGMPIGAESQRPQQLMVLAMGKQGGGELNVSSDIDLIFVYPEDGDTAAGAGQRSLSNHEFFNRLGKKLIAALAEVIEDGFVFRVDMALRPNGNSGPLVASLSVLADKQLLPAETVTALLAAYTFLRNLEHRLQYRDDAQTHTLPAGEEERALLAAMMGLPDTNALLGELAGHRRYVASQFDAIFSDKVQGGEDDVQLQSSGSEADIDNLAAIEARLANLHFDEPGAGARRLMATWQAPRLQSLPEASRTRLLALLNAALPLIAHVVAEAGVGKHSATLARLLDFFEAIARRSAYLSLLTEYPHTLERVIRMMNASGWAATFLSQHPILLDEMLDDRVRGGAPDCPALAAELSAQLAGAEGDTERQMDLLRDFHHAQLFRLLAQDLAGSLSVERLADYLSALADLIVEAVVGAAWRTVATRHRDTPRFAVIAYGKLGGKELGYVSDLDVIFLFDDEDQDAPANYAKLAQRFITWMTAHTSAGILFDIDTALRPDGASGMLVSSVAAFERYQASSAWVWEHQALTRARFCAGDAATGARFEAIREQVLRRERDGEALREEVLKMRQRMHAAQTPGAGFDLKQDAGGMIDIEFMVQYLVLRHAHDYPQLTANSGNIALLKTCGELKLIDPAQAGAVADAYRAMRKLQHQVRLQGQDNARVEPALVAKHAEAVRALWLGLFSG